MNLEERRNHIVARRATDAARHTEAKFDELEVNLGRLTSKMRDEAHWRADDHLYPAWQVYADELERVLSFAEECGQLARCWPNLIARKPQRDAAIDELRIALHLTNNAFQIIDWEPIGEDGNRGEYLIRGPANSDMFVEVKGPRWEGELSEGEIQAGRTKELKELYLEARAVAPWKRIQFEVEKAYKKFMATIPNLLIIAGHRGFVSLEHGTEMHANQALYEANLKGCFANGRYANLGGVGIFWMGTDGAKTWYEMKLFANPYALEPLPDDLLQTFS